MIPEGRYMISGHWSEAVYVECVDCRGEPIGYYTPNLTIWTNDDLGAEAADIRAILTAIEDHETMCHA